MTNAIGSGRCHFQEYVQPSGHVYANWMMECPHHHNCHRVRGLGKNNIKNGLLEPLAFLHVWKETPPGALGHRPTPPDPVEVLAFLREHKAELEAIFGVFATP